MKLHGKCDLVAWALSRVGVYGGILAGAGVGHCLTSDAPQWALPLALFGLGAALAIVGGLFLFVYDRAWES